MIPRNVLTIWLDLVILLLLVTGIISVAHADDTLWRIDPLNNGTITDEISLTVMDVSRNSAATWSDAAGCYTVAVNTARIDSDGLIIEPGGTNIITDSEDFTIDAAPWTDGVGTGDCAVGSDAVSSPLSGVDADALQGTLGVTNYHYVYAVGVAAAGQTWTASVFARDGTLSPSRLVLGFGTGGFAPISFTGINISDGSAIAVGEGWFRLSVTATAPATTAYLIMQCLPANGWFYAGTGGEEAYFWGADLEEKPYVTEYVRTGGGAVTTADEYAYMALPASVSTAVASGQDGCAVVEVCLSQASDFTGTTNYYPLLTCAGAADAPLLYMGYTGGASGVWSTDSAATTATAAPTWSAGDSMLVAVRWGGGNFQIGYRASGGAWTWGAAQAFDGFTVDGANQLVLGRKYAANMKPPCRLRTAAILDFQPTAADMAADFVVGSWAAYTAPVTGGPPIRWWF